MDLDETIFGRRSVRAYEEKPVEKDKIEAVLEAGIWAPSGMNKQPWKFVVIEDRQKIKMLSEATKEILKSMDFPDNFRGMLSSEKDLVFYDAPLLILVCIEVDEEWKSVSLLDCGLAAQNMFLKAYDLGLGSCFIGFGNFLNGRPEILSEVGIPEGHELVAPLIFGYPDEEPEPKAREKRILYWHEG
jgi:nitroreductase